MQAETGIGAGRGIPVDVHGLSSEGCLTARRAALLPPVPTGVCIKQGDILPTVLLRRGIGSHCN